MFLLVLLCILTSIIPSKDRPDSKADALLCKCTLLASLLQSWATPI